MCQLFKFLQRLRWVVRYCFNQLWWLLSDDTSNAYSLSISLIKYATKTNNERYSKTSNINIELIESRFLCSLLYFLYFGGWCSWQDSGSWDSSGFESRFLCSSAPRLSFHLSQDENKIINLKLIVKCFEKVLSKMWIWANWDQLRGFQNSKQIMSASQLQGCSNVTTLAVPVFPWRITQGQRNFRLLLLKN